MKKKSCLSSWDGCVSDEYVGFDKPTIECLRNWRDKASTSMRHLMASNRGRGTLYRGCWDYSVGETKNIPSCCLWDWSGLSLDCQPLKKWAKFLRQSDSAILRNWLTFVRHRDAPKIFARHQESEGVVRGGIMQFLFSGSLSGSACSARYDYFLLGWWLSKGNRHSGSSGESYLWQDFW